ncbi:MAG: hypothetical protein ACRD3Q_19125 [Terriglobales bacterium]
MPDEVRADYTYYVYLCAYPGWWRRWRGRVITRDSGGVRDIWAWQTARHRDALLASLSAEVDRDMQRRRTSGSIEVLEATYNAE